MKINQHVHVNGYEMGAGLEEKLQALGFWPDPFRQDKSPGIRYMPPYHYSFETADDPEAMHLAFERAVEMLAEDHDFKGYIESEHVPERRKAQFSLPSFVGKIPFPFEPCEMIEALPPKYKACDIHTKRPLDIPRDGLDDLFHAHGFYEVHTPRHRIYTIQIETIADGVKAFELLKDYFGQVGGVKQIYLEITAGFWRKPYDFPVPAILKRGFLHPFGKR